MEILLFLNLIIGLVVAGKVFIKPKQGQAQLTAGPSDTLALSSGHTLVRVWDNRTCERERQGWWFECSCGMKRAGDETNSKSFGTESSAIRSYKTHSNLHADLGTAKNQYKELYEAEKDKFERYKEACYCKNLNDDIILLERE